MQDVYQPCTQGRVYMLCGGFQKKNLSVCNDLYFMPPSSVPPVGSPIEGR